MKKILLIGATMVVVVAAAVQIKNKFFTEDQADYPWMMEASYSVDHNGNGNYVIPILTPPGTSQMDPHLSLSYSTIPTNEYVGVGWKLLGLSEITRVSATRAQDGFFSALNYSSTDRYALDGQRLILVSGSYTSDSAVFHTQIESWSKVVGYKQCGVGFCFFKVWMKNGLIKEYNSVVNAAGTSNVQKWMISKITDRNGNYMSFSYNVEPINSVAYPDQITYTQNSGLKHFRYVNFSYEHRPDSIPVYQGGYMIKYNKRLKTITASLASVVGMMYNLDYDVSYSTGKSVLKKITQCDGQGKCLPPTTISWTQQSNDLFNDATDVAVSSVPREGVNLPMDVNGDGLIDYVHAWQGQGSSNVNNILQLGIFLSSGTGFNPVVNVNTGLLFTANLPLRSMEINGDGKVDLVYLTISQQNRLQYNVLLSNGNGFNIGTTNSTTVQYYTPGNIVPLDVNGDGMSDLVLPSQSEDNSLVYQALISNGSSFSTQPPDTLTVDAPSGYINLVPARLNSDPYTDLVYSYSTGSARLKIIPLISNGSGFYPGSMLDSTQALAVNTHLLPLDMNGDGLSDLLVTWMDEASTKLAMFMSNGVCLVETEHSYHQPTFPTEEATIIPLDINGDNRTDFTYSKKNSVGAITLSSYISDGRTFTTLQKPDSLSQLWSQYGLIPADINGDAKSDLINIAGSISDTTSQVSYLIASYPYPDLADTIANSVGGQIAIQYSTMTDPEVYTPGGVSSTLIGGNNAMNKISGATYGTGDTNGVNGTYGTSFPIVSEMFPIYIVSGYVQSDGMGNSWGYNIKYSGAKIDLSGYGWLGFASKQVADTSTNVGALSWYGQEFPRTGNIDSSITYRNSDRERMAIFSAKYSTSNPVKIQSNIQQVLTTGKYTRLYTYGHYDYTVGTEFSYDVYGNVSLIKELGNLAMQSRQSYTLQNYLYDTSSWQLGLLSEKKVAIDSLGKQFLSWEKYQFNLRTWEMQQQKRWISDTSWVAQSYHHDNFGNRTRIYDQYKDSTSLIYDTTYQTFPNTIISAANAQGARLINSYVYDPFFGQLKSKSDPNGNTTVTIYNSMGRVLATLGPNESGKLDTLSKTKMIATSPAGYSIQTSVLTNWESNTWHNVWNYQDGIDRNYRIVSEGANADTLKVTQRILDTKGRVIRESVPYFNGTHPDSILWVTKQYDPYGRVVQILTPVANHKNSITLVTYPNDSVTNKTIAAGTADSSRSISIYGWFGSQKILTRNIDGSDNTTRYIYDPIGRLKSAIDPLGMKCSVSYNGISQRTTFSDASIGKTTYSYDIKKNAVRQTYANGDWVNTRFDNLQRPVAISSSRSDSSNLIYDSPAAINGLGNLTEVSMANSLGYSYEYDQYNNIASIAMTIGGNKYVSTQTYTPNHLLDQFQYPDGSRHRFLYSLDGNVHDLQVDDATDGEAGNYVSYLRIQSYNALNKPLSTVHGNGVTTLHGWDPNGMLSHQTVVNEQGATLADRSYSWNYRYHLMGIANQLDTSQSQWFQYDRSGRLIKARSINGLNTYSYDAGGNLLAKNKETISYKGYEAIDASNAGDSVFTATYDANGNTTSKKTSKGITKYHYDAYQRLESVVRNDTTLLQFVYDYNGGRLIKKDFIANEQTFFVSPNYMINVVGDGDTLHTKHVIGPSGYVASITKGASSIVSTTSPVVTRSNSMAIVAWGLLIGINLLYLSFFVRRKRSIVWLAPIAFVAITVSASGCSTAHGALFSFNRGIVEQAGRPQPGTLFYHQNQVNSTTFTTDEHGNIETTVNYLPYGEIYSIEGPDNFVHKFGSKQFDEQSDLNYFNARYYDAQLGRFITPDSQLGGDVDQPGVFNRYAYTLNNPVTFVDPSGHSVFSWFASMITDIVEIAAGVAIDVLSDGTLGMAGKALIGSGVGGLTYSATHFNNFSWKDWAIQEAIGGATGMVEGGGASGEAATSSAVSAADLLPEEAGQSAGRSLCFREMGANQEMELEEFHGDGVSISNAQCFVAGTLIATAHGEKPIEEIQVGDQVWSFNEITQTTELNAVTRLFRSYGKSIVEVQIGGETIRTTPEHPFFVESRGWVKAIELTSDDKVVTSNHKTTFVSFVAPNEKPEQVYNFEVANAHTYYISPAKVLVHNMCQTPRGNWYDVEISISRKRWPESAQHIEDAQLKKGKPEVLTIQRNMAKTNRANSLRGIAIRAGRDRDEYPPAMFQEGGYKASVRYLTPSDNRGSGSFFGAVLRHTNGGGPWPNGTQVWFHVVP